MRLLRAIEFCQQLVDTSVSHLVVVVAKSTLGIATSGRVTIVGSTLDGADLIKTFRVINGLDQKIQNLFLNNYIRCDAKFSS